MSDEIPSVSELRAHSAEHLANCGIDSAVYDVDQLLMHVLDVDKAGLILAELDQDQLNQFQTVLDRRAKREPLQHILGMAYFRNLTLDVGPGVFVPRPETEVLVELALKSLPEAVTTAPTTQLGKVPTSIVDLCAGSGVIPLAIATELDPTRLSLTAPITVYAVELDDSSIEWTRRNAELQKPAFPVDIQFKVVQADARTAATEELARLRGQVSLVTCNPPYVPDTAIPRDPEVRDYDPAIALYGGEDGLDVVRDIVQTAADLLHPGGVLLIEHGDQQGEGGGVLGVPHVIRTNGGFTRTQDHQDLTGRPRVTSAERT